MSRLDRLSSLVSQFEISSREPISYENANLIILGEGSHPEKVVIMFRPKSVNFAHESIIASTFIDFGGRANPIIEALPEEVDVSLAGKPDLKPLADLIVSEINSPRCGSQFALDRLCEFLLVSILRQLIETSQSNTGLLAGLAHPNLSPVLVAIHDMPERQWKLDDLVELSGQSRSQFMETFHAILGKSPISYLKLWRMTLARNALLGGERVKETARRFGYGSGDAFTRAFTATYGVSPTRFSSLEDTQRQ